MCHLQSALTFCQEMDPRHLWDGLIYVRFHLEHYLKRNAWVLKFGRNSSKHGHFLLKVWERNVVLIYNF